jgi:hypothetical protein
LSGIRPRHSDGPVSPTAKELREYWAKVPIHSRRGRHRWEVQVPARHNGPNTCGEEMFHRAVSHASSSLARRHAVDAAANHVPPTPHSECSSHPPTVSSDRHTTPRPQPALQVLSWVGRGEPGAQVNGTFCRFGCAPCITHEVFTQHAPCTPGATVNLGWREADDYQTEVRGERWLTGRYELRESLFGAWACQHK